jgi:hypothetical protein
MKKTTYVRVIALLAAGSFSAGTARAQYETMPLLRQPATFERTGFGDRAYRDDYLAQPGQVGERPGVAQVSAPQEPPVFAPARAGCCDGEGACCDPAAGGDKPWTLPQPCFLQKLGVNMGGWLQQGITLNADRPADRFNGPNATNDRDREYQLNQLWLYFLRPTKTEGCGWDIGGRIDVVYGTDWRFGQCFGLENRFNDVNSFYGLILPQFYLEVAYNDLTVKMGHFATFTAYEVVPGAMNFFYSHSYLMTGYFDPLLVTGVQAEYKLTDYWTTVGGFNRGWQEFEDPSDTLNFLGGLKWAGDDKRSTLSVMLDTGRQLGFTGVHDRTSCYVVFTHQLNERLSYASDLVVGREAHGSVVNPGDDADWFGIEQMFIYKLSPKWSAGLRYEWVRDIDGARIAGIGNALLTDRGWDGGPGFTGSFHDVSLGLNYRPHPNFVFRPEVRWDWYDGPPSLTRLPNGQVPLPQLPFDNHTRSSQFTAAMDMIVTF